MSEVWWHIDVEDCISKIDESRINREKHANVYVYADKSSVGLFFAYSDVKEDEIVLERISDTCHENLLDELWKEYLSVGETISRLLNVRLVIDDVRPKSINNIKFNNLINSSVIHRQEDGVVFAGHSGRGNVVMPFTSQDLVNRIKQLCNERKYDYITLSRNSGVPLTTILNIVKGNTKNPGIFTILKLCDGFGITLEEFMQIKYLKLGE